MGGTLVVLCMNYECTAFNQKDAKMAEDRKEVGMSPVGQAAIGMGLQAGQTLIDQIFLERNMRAQRRQADYNQKLALEMWDKTNYAAQRRQMEKAGLNVGLMYKGAGEGGRTAGSGVAEQAIAPAPNLGMGLQHGMQAAQTQAQIELTKAQTENVQADTKKKQGVDTQKVYVEMEKIAQETNNIVVKNAIDTLQKELLEIDVRVKGSTIEEQITQIHQQADKALGEAMSALAKGNVDTEMQDTVKEAMRTGVAEAKARISALKAGLIKTNAETANIKEHTQKLTSEIKLNYQQKFINWEKLNYEQREVIVKETLAKLQTQQVEFNTSTPQQIRQWIGIFGDIASGVGDVAKAVK